MLMRASVVAVLSAFSLLCAAAPASAQPTPTTWDEAAAFARFPVWRPDRTLGLRGQAGTRTCEFGDVPQVVHATYRKRGSRKRFALVEHLVGSSCGNPEVWDAVRVVRIGGRRVVIRGSGVGLSATLVQPAQRWHGGERARRTSIHATALGFSLRAFVRMLRSLRVVDVQRPTVNLRGFLSSDGSVWCGIGGRFDDGRWCSSHDPPYGAHVSPDGALVLCGAAAPAVPLCIQNWDENAFRLSDGQSSDIGGFVCRDAAGAVTCTVKEGDAAGIGFRVDVTGSAAVGPS